LDRHLQVALAVHQPAAKVVDLPMPMLAPLLPARMLHQCWVMSAKQLLPEPTLLAQNLFLARTFTAHLKLGLLLNKTASSNLSAAKMATMATFLEVLTLNWLKQWWRTSATLNCHGMKVLDTSRCLMNAEDTPMNITFTSGSVASTAQLVSIRAKSAKQTMELRCTASGKTLTTLSSRSLMRAVDTLAGLRNPQTRMSTITMSKILPRSLLVATVQMMMAHW
jgi:hypothetical protein